MANRHRANDASSPRQGAAAATTSSIRRLSVEPLEERRLLTVGDVVLHSFAGPLAGDGDQPQAPLTLVGSKLYGTTSAGGTGGILFSMNEDGTDYTILHTFGSSDDGSSPTGPLTLVGSTLYGTTSSGGQFGYGTVFSISLDGTGYSIVYSFSGNVNIGGDSDDGAQPNSGLTLVGSTLYGTTSLGGQFGFGTDFSMSLDGSSFHLLHSFALDSQGGEVLPGPLTLVGSTLYGTTTFGGTASAGTVYSMNEDGTNFTTLESFPASNNGSQPSGGLTQVGSALYGVTEVGGDNQEGSVFSIGTDGSNFTTLHSFDDTSDEPLGGLTLMGSRLYGMTVRGSVGASVFSINPDGSNYTTVYTFPNFDGIGQPTDASLPEAALTPLANELVGTSVAGGATDQGTVFAIRGLSTDTWTGNAGDNLWSDPDNWSSGGVPGPYDNVVISASGNPTIIYDASAGNSVIGTLSLANASASLAAR